MAFRPESFSQAVTTGVKMANDLASGAGKVAGLVSSAPTALYDAAASASKAVSELGAKISTSGFSLGSIKDAAMGVVSGATASNPLGINNAGPVRTAALEMTSPYTAKEGYQIYRIPYDVPGNYHMMIEFRKYQKITIAQNTQQTPTFAVVLPLPNNLQEAFGLKYSEVEMGTLIGPAGEKIGELVDGMAKAQNGKEMEDAVAKSVGGMMNTKGSTVGNAALVIGRKAVGAATSVFDDGSINANIDRAFGNVPNPRLSVAFQGVGLRAHQFSWKLIPRNQEEAKRLREMLKRLKAASLPPKEQDFFLGYPDVAHITISTKPFGEELIKFKLCFMDNIAINYAPSSTPAFHNDKSPVEYEIAMSFKEIEVFTREDFEG